jgi:hypothetical protein
VQKWQELGLVFPYNSKIKHTVSHCQCPTPYHLDGDIYRVFFATRNAYNTALIAYYDIDIITQKILDYSPEPVIINGSMGYFDYNGVYPFSIIKKNNDYLLYTGGFTKGEDYLYYIRIGLATSPDLKTFQKHSTVPLMNISAYDPWLLTSPFVMYDDNKYRMWYTSGQGWNDQGQSFYYIKYCESDDALNWNRQGHIAINYTYDDERNLARPWIIKEDGIYKAWVCYTRGKLPYRIGYGESYDGGFTFERQDYKINLNVSDEIWKNEMICYPAVINHNGQKYMFYNGNRFGKDGIALAVEE